MIGAEEKMRKAKIICIFSIICMTIFLQVGCGQKNDVAEDIAVQGSFVEFSYEELKDTAKIIAKIEVTDDLTTENSFEITDPETGTSGGFYGKRTCKVLEYYKDVTGNYAEELSFIEAAAIIEGQYLHIDGYDAIQKGHQYIVYLNDDTASGDMSVMSCNNGVVRLDEKESNLQFPEIAAKTIEEAAAQ